MVIDAVIDVICPWCYLGKRRLEAALRAAQLPAALQWKPYQLLPQTPPRGLDRQRFLARRFPDPAPRLRQEAELTAAGREAGVEFELDRIERIPNTFDAHRLIWMAGAAGAAANETVEALFRAYFTGGVDIGGRAALVQIAAAAGLDPEAARMALEGTAGTAEVEAGLAWSRDREIDGVPFFFIDGKPAVAGAQPPEVFAAALRAQLPTLERKNY